jgi:hypothetical protein
MFNYLIGILLAITVACSGFAYYEYNQVQRLSVEVGTYKSAAAANLKAKEDSDASCLVTVDTLNGYYNRKAETEAVSKAIQSSIDSLPTLTIKEKANEAPTKSQTPSTRYSDDDRLSPDLMRLLDNAYCNGREDNCTSPTK